MDYQKKGWDLQDSKFIDLDTDKDKILYIYLYSMNGEGKKFGFIGYFNRKGMFYINDGCWLNPLDK
jgi:hypothetical protein